MFHVKHDDFINCVLASTVSLVSTSERNPERLRLHIEDSLAALQLGLRPPRTIIDVGSGAGFPAVPLALALPAVTTICVESVSRKAKFLEQTAKSLDLQEQIEIVNNRIEAVTAPGKPLRERGDWVTLRAVADPVISMEYGAPAVAQGGSLMLYCTVGQYSEHRKRLAAAARSLGLDEPSATKVSSPLRTDAAIITSMRSSPCPERYPRRTGLARARPLA